MSLLGFHSTMGSTRMHTTIRTHRAWPFPEPVEEAEPTAEPALLGVVRSRAYGLRVKARLEWPSCSC